MALPFTGISIVRGTRLPVLSAVAFAGSSFTGQIVELEILATFLSRCGSPVCISLSARAGLLRTRAFSYSRRRKLASGGSRRSMRGSMGTTAQIRFGPDQEARAPTWAAATVAYLILKFLLLLLLQHHLLLIELLDRRRVYIRIEVRPVEH